MRFDRILPFLTFLGFSLVILLFVAMSQKPLCIDSRVVERMDRVHAGKTETVFRCQIQKRVPYSKFWAEAQWSQRLASVERFLEGIEPFKRKYQISVRSDAPYLYRLRGSQVFLGEKVLFAEGQLERLMISLWVYEKAQATPERPDLILETVSDFVLSLFRGQVVNPINGLPLDENFLAWPSILRSPKGYCEGSWAAPHHYQFCFDLIQSSIEPESKNFVTLSLRPYAVAHLRSSYSELSLRQKNVIYKNIAKILRALDLRHPDLYHQNHISDLLGSKKAFRLIGDQIFQAGQILGVSEVQTWASYYKLKIADDFQDGLSAHARVDYIFDFSTLSVVELQSRIREMNPWVVQKKLNKIAVIGHDEIYFLPDTNGVALAQFGQLKARTRLIESCQDIEISHLFELEQFSENIIVVQNCQQETLPKYVSLMRGGVVDFAMNNKKVNFIAAHAPSFLSRKGELLDLPYMFSSLRQHQQKISKVFLWSDLVFDDTAEAYTPQSGIEGIQYFRVHHPY